MAKFDGSGSDVMKSFTEYLLTGKINKEDPRVSFLLKVLAKNHKSALSVALRRWKDPRTSFKH